MPETMVMCDNLVKIYKVADLEVGALQGLDLEVAPGEMMAIVGASGSGKTMLLNILISLDDPTSGSVLVLGRELAKPGESERAHLRSHNVGMMFQNAHLFPSLTAQENVEIPPRLMRMEPERRMKKAQEVLEQVHLGARTSPWPGTVGRRVAKGCPGTSAGARATVYCGR